jgi:hypothetical protein
VRLIEHTGSILGVFGKLLEILKQKAYVYVDVCFGADVEAPYRLTVANHSSYDILLLGLNVMPDGFPDIDNGWQLNNSKLFENKILKPHQKIRFVLRGQDIGEYATRRFKVNYHPQRRWLEKIVLKGTIVFAVVT